MADLDKPRTYEVLDPSGMFRHLRQMPEQCEQAWQSALRFELPREYDRVNKAAILGMGGSAIGGDLLCSVALMENRAPVWVHRAYGLAPFLDENTLLVASSYSGNTEETVSSFAESLATPAKKLVITSGGRLQALAQQEGIPIFPITYQGPPRAAFPHSFVPLLAIFQRLGLIEDKSADLAEATQALSRLSGEFVDTVPVAANPAKQLATALSGRACVIYGAGFLSAVARRWKTQFNENSKAWAFHEALPELNHNAVVGYQFPSQFKQAVLVVLLHSSLLHPRISDRYQLTSEVLEKAGVSHRLVEAEGKSALAHMLSLILLGDYVSSYLALLNGVDPTPVDSIDYLKKRLAEI